MDTDEHIYEDTVRQLQKEAMEELQKTMAKAKRAEDLVRAERLLFLIKLVRARHRRKLTQAHLAEVIGMRQSTLSRIESGRGNPGLTTLLRIAKALGVVIVLE